MAMIASLSALRTVVPLSNPAAADPALAGHKAAARQLSTPRPELPLA